MKNRDKLYRLYAKIPGSLYHVRFHGYDYINQKTGDTERRSLNDFDIVLIGYLKLNSDMRNPIRNDGKGKGTGLTHWYSAKMISDSSRPRPVEIDKSDTNQPAWSVRKVQYSLKRLAEAGFLDEKVAPNAARKSHLQDPLTLPSRREKVENELIESKWKEEEKHV